jgi:alpha-beta hydrolase superfamily lysophospholipase
VDKYVADPLCGFSATVQLWIDLLEGWAGGFLRGASQSCAQVAALYLISGGRDPVSGSMRQLESWMAEYRGAALVNLAHKFYPEARHELFNETNRDDVTANLIGWLDQVVARATGDARGIAPATFD